MTYTFNKKYIWLLSVICTALFVGVLIMSTPFVFAQEKQVEYTLLEPLPCIESAAVQNERGEVVTPAITCGGNTQMTSINFENYVQYAFNLVIALAAVLAVFMIVWGGFEYMSSDSYNQKSAGLEKLKNAVYGLVLILCSYLILRTIDPRLVQIPTTLVTPIDIRCASNRELSVTDSRCVSSSASTFFGQLTKTMSEFHTSVESAKQDLAKSQQIVSTLEERKKSLCDQLTANISVSDPLLLQQNSGAPYKDPCLALANRSSGLGSDARSIATQILAQDAAIRDEQANALLVVAKAAINQRVLDSDPSTGSIANKTPEQLSTDLNSEYQTRRAALIAIGAAPNQLKSLEDYTNYSNKLEQINTQVAYATQVVINDKDLWGPVAWWYQSSNARTLNEAVGYAQNQINTVVNGCSSSVSDPALCQQLVQKATEARQKLKSLKIQ